MEPKPSPWSDRPLPRYVLPLTLIVIFGGPFIIASFVNSTPTKPSRHAPVTTWTPPEPQADEFDDHPKVVELRQVIAKLETAIGRTENLADQQEYLSMIRRTEFQIFTLKKDLREIQKRKGTP